MADVRSKTSSRDRVRGFVRELGLESRILEFEHSTKTAQMAADAAGCELGQIVKSLVFVVDGRPIVALVAGDRRGDGDAIARATGGVRVSFADADTVREATGYAIGSVSPFDLPDGLPILIDDSLSRFDVLYPAAGTQSAMIRLNRDELLAIVGGRVARISH